MARYQVFLETSEKALAEGGYLAHVPELAGCAARGRTKEEAIAGIRATIRACQESAEPFELEIVETDDMTFPPDRTPLSDKDLQTLDESAAASRQKLLDLVSSIPPGALTWRETDETWAIRSILTHLASADVWYASRLKDPGIRELLWRLEATRALLIKQLAELPVEARGVTMRHDDEEWTPRKVIRRMLEHEREHLDQIARILARREQASKD